MAPRRPTRRAQRATPRQIKSYLAAAEKSELAEIAKDVIRKTARTLQEFAVLSMNELAERGPARTGEFSASWGFAPAGVTPVTPGTTGRIYKYTKNDVRVTDVERHLKNGVTRFSIVNTSDHASIAVDEESASFKFKDTTLKEIEYGTGRYQQSFRYEIGDQSSPGKGSASRTADPFWFQLYSDGGFLQRDLSTAVSLGFNRF